MRESLDEPVSVIWYYDARTRHMKPHMLNWKGRDYALGKIDFWHKTWDGRHQIHHFSITDRKNQVYFKLALNTDNLQWVLEEYMTAENMSLEYQRSTT